MPQSEAEYYAMLEQQAQEEDRFAQESMVRAAAQNEQWVAKWPNYCKSCCGWGGSKFTQHHDSGPGEQMFDLCEALPATQCHRCGEQGLDSEGNGPCKSCGWDFDDGLASV